MSQAPNLSTLTTSDGSIFAYSGDGGAIRRSLVTGPEGAPAAVALVPTSKWRGAHGPDDGCVGAALEPAAVDATHTGAPPVDKRHVFYTVRKHHHSKHIHNHLWYFLDSAPEQPGPSDHYPVFARQIDYGDGGFVSGFDGIFGVASSVQGAFVAGRLHSKGQNAIQISGIPWAALTDEHWMEGVQHLRVDLGQIIEGELPKNDPEVSCSFFRDAMKPAEAYLCVFVLYEGAGGSRVLWFLVRVADDLSLDRVDPGQPPTTVPADLASLTGLKVAARPDSGLQFFCYGNDGTLYQARASYHDLLTSVIDPDSHPGGPWKDGEDARIASLSEMAPSYAKAHGLDSGEYPADLIFAGGEPQETPSTANPQLVDRTIPITPQALYVDGYVVKRRSAQETQPWGYLRRRGLPEVKGKDILLGIIEGPPPLPHQNVNLSPDYDPYRNNVPGVAKITYAASKTVTRGFDASWGMAWFASLAVEADVGLFLSVVDIGTRLGFEAELNLAYRGSYEEVTVKNLLTSHFVEAKFEQVPDPKGGTHWVTEPIGSAILQTSAWSGYTYEFQDSTGATPGGAWSHTALFPSGIEVKAFPYVIDTSAPGTPTPGDLESYFVDEEERKSLDQNATKLGTGSSPPYLVNQWSVGTGTTTRFETYRKTSLKMGFSLGFKSLFSLNGEADLFGSGFKEKEAAGLSVDTSMNWSTGKTDSVGLESLVWCRGAIDAPDSYVSYEYDVYQLERSERWAKEFLESLVSETFPANPDERAINEALKERICADSKPWRICYVVDEVQFNEPTSAAFAGHRALEARYGALFQAAGLTTTALALRAMRAVSTGEEARFVEDLATQLKLDPKHLRSAMAELSRISAGDRAELVAVLSGAGHRAVA